jgi:hypothetical protein
MLALSTLARDFSQLKVLRAVHLSMRIEAYRTAVLLVVDFGDETMATALADAFERAHTSTV